MDLSDSKQWLLNLGRAGFDGDYAGHGYVGDLSPFAEHDAELREADTVKLTRSSSRSSEQQRTDDVGPSSVPVADTSVLATSSSVPAAAAPVAIPGHLERRIAEVISAIEALWEELHKNDRERKESGRVRQEQHKELVNMIQTL
ncbi:hypothetical protein Q3G72_015819 [Acer saccharum]|nr:hypothetical protein Q3G72_015819 [Acer saccharum]